MNDKDPFIMTKDEEISQVNVDRPHIVILGAGASIATVAGAGDKNGKKLPGMDNLVDIIGLKNTLTANGIVYKGENFEEFYSHINNDKIAQIIEGQIYNYFDSLELPDHPTIYDYLVLSLRSKDLIATFNWDPFLIQALKRNADRFKSPHTVFLHGNVKCGYCMQDLRKGLKGERCSRCRQVFTATRLLYPINQKDYHKMEFIRDEWGILETMLKNAFMITIFGYGAPKTDSSAIDIMTQAWGKIQDRNMEQIEMIDIKNEDELCKTWNSFIHTHHYQVVNDFYNSWIARHPRRTGEAWNNQFIEAKFIEDNPIPQNIKTLDELWKWFEPLRLAEDSTI